MDAGTFTRPPSTVAMQLLLGASDVPRERKDNTERNGEPAGAHPASGVRGRLQRPVAAIGPIRKLGHGTEFTENCRAVGDAMVRHARTGVVSALTIGITILPTQAWKSRR